ELLGDLLGFTDARVRLADAIFRGSAYALICGERRMRSGGDDGPVLARWAPTALVDVDRRRFRARYTPEGYEWDFWSIEREAYEPLTEEQRRWFVRCTFDSTEDSLAYGRGLLDTIFYFQALKTGVLRDCATASE